MCDFHTFSFNNVKNKVVLPVFIQFRVNDSMQLNAVLGNSKLGSIYFQGKRGYMTSWESTTKEAARICGIALKRKNFTDCWFINVNGKEYSMTQALKTFVFEDNLFDQKLSFQFSVNCTCCQLFQTSNQDGGDKALTGRTMKSRQNQISDDSKPKNKSGLKIRVSLSDPDSERLVAESHNKQNRYQKIELTNPVEVVKETRIVINPISPSKHGKRQTSKKSAADNGKKKPALDPNDLSNWLYSSEEDDDDFCWTPKDLVWLDENVEHYILNYPENAPKMLRITQKFYMNNNTNWLPRYMCEFEHTVNKETKIVSLTRYTIETIPEYQTLFEDWANSEQD